MSSRDSIDEVDGSFQCRGAAHALSRVHVVVLVGVIVAGAKSDTCAGVMLCQYIDVALVVRSESSSAVHVEESYILHGFLCKAACRLLQFVFAEEFASIDFIGCHLNLRLSFCCCVLSALYTLVTKFRYTLSKKKNEAIS